MDWCAAGDLDGSQRFAVGWKLSQNCIEIGLHVVAGERDPKKRRVKPVDQHLLQLDFGGLDDSSDDSDYEVADFQDGMPSLCLQCFAFCT